MSCQRLRIGGDSEKEKERVSLRGQAQRDSPEIVEKTSQEKTATTPFYHREKGGK